MDLTTLLQEVGRPCTKFEVGGFRPTYEIEESWLGRVSLFLPDEIVPSDKHGNQMMELGQFFLPALPHVPASLSDVSLVTAFISPEFEGDSDLMEGCFEIREYPHVDMLVHKETETETDGSGLKPFPLRPEQAMIDNPIWDGGGLTSKQEDAFLALERSSQISNYYDVTSHVYGHKFGGYPSFCQSGVDLDPYEFVFQVSSDAKIGLNVIDSGSLMFWRHPKLETWKLYYDFY